MKLKRGKLSKKCYYINDNGNMFHEFYNSRISPRSMRIVLKNKYGPDVQHKRDIKFDVYEFGMRDIFKGESDQKYINSMYLKKNNMILGNLKGILVRLESGGFSLDGKLRQVAPEGAPLFVSTELIGRLNFECKIIPVRTGSYLIELYTYFIRLSERGICSIGKSTPRIKDLIGHVYSFGKAPVLTGNHEIRKVYGEKKWAPVVLMQRIGVGLPIGTTVFEAPPAGLTHRGLALFFVRALLIRNGIIAIRVPKK